MILRAIFEYHSTDNNVTRIKSICCLLASSYMFFVVYIRYLYMYIKGLSCHALYINVAVRSSWCGCTGCIFNISIEYK